MMVQFCSGSAAKSTHCFFVQKREQRVIWFIGPKERSPLFYWFKKERIACFIGSKERRPLIYWFMFPVTASGWSRKLNNSPFSKKKKTFAAKRDLKRFSDLATQRLSDLATQRFNDYSEEKIYSHFNKETPKTKRR